MTVTRLRSYPQPRADGLELTEVPRESLSDSEFFAAMKAGIPDIAPPVMSNNERIDPINQERLDHEAANPQTRTNYKGIY